MHIRGIRSAFLVTGAALIFAAGPAAAAPPPPEIVVSPQVKFLEFNYCGASEAVPTNTLCGTPGVYQPQLADQIQSYRPSVVMISEICQNQLTQVLADLANNTNPPTFAGVDFDEIDSDRDGCGSNKHYGNYILTKNSLTNVQEAGLPSGPQSITCGTTLVGSASVALAVCNTHLIAGNDAITDDQEDAAHGFAYSYATGKALVYGGDLNLEPTDNELDDVSHLANGNFQEMDQCGGATEVPGVDCDRVTHVDYQNSSNKRKLDYLWFKQAYARNASPQVPLNSTKSDHHLYFGAIDICASSDC